jgi:folate-binding protein YgfZ
MVRTIGGRIPTSIRRNDKLGQIGYDLIVLSNRAPTLWQVLVENGAFPAGEDSYQGLRIKSGFPEEPVELESAVRVMEVDRPKTAIADNKGCYLGQEPIVMARDRGQLNRKLRRVKIQASGLSSGAFSVDGKEIGRLCSHTGLGNGVWLGLAYLRRGFWETGSQWACESSNGPMILDVL